MAVNRKLKQSIAQRLFGGKVIVVVGPRQTGKTTLINHVLAEAGKPCLFLNGDDPAVRRLLDTPTTEEIGHIIGQNELVFIDEAQRISNIGITSKIIADHFKDKQLILSGSSALDLGDKLQEPLTGRKWTYEMFPISWGEWQDHVGYVTAEKGLDIRLVYGFYPDVLMNPHEQQEILQELADSYLYKDILAYAGLRKPGILMKLVQALAYQMGQEVVYQEVGKLIGLDAKTVEHYIHVLEQAFVLFRLPAFSKNLRNEIKATRKVYFYDNGIRNAVINAYQPLAVRQDVGALWENFLISERMKKMHYAKTPVQRYFWRTKQQQEVDYVELRDSEVFGYEFKWNPRRKIRFSKTFTEAYQAETMGVTRENFRDFVL